MTRRRIIELRSSLEAWALCILGAVIVACGHEPSAPSARDVQLSFARSASSSLTVSSTSPDSASQDTTLDVAISGSGFIDGSKATWQLAGVADSAQVRTNSTRYVNPKQLVANITISRTATAGKWDVAVYAGTKGGVGTEMFAIRVKSNTRPPASTFYLSNSTSYLLRGDGLYLEGASSAYSGMSRYLDEECGVNGVLYSLPGGSGDATMQSDVITKTCPNYPRGIRLTFALINPDGSTTPDGSETTGTFLNLLALQRAAGDTVGAISIPIGATELRNFILNDKSQTQPTAPKGGKCTGMRFRPVAIDGTVTGSDQVLVTRTASDTWVVQTQPDQIDSVTHRTIHHDKMWCQSNGKLYHMPAYFVIRSSVPVSP